jgi:hypothetical protein
LEGGPSLGGISSPRALCRRRMSATRMTVMHTATTPPTAPPTMAPMGCGCGDGAAVVTGGGGGVAALVEESGTVREVVGDDGLAVDVGGGE